MELKGQSLAADDTCWWTYMSRIGCW